VANLPYGAATPLMLNLLIDFPACARQGVTIQREVAQRLAAQPGSKDYGTLSVVAQAMATVEIIAKLPPECFWPRPEITSAMVLLTRREQPATAHPARLALLCQRLFSQRRKQLGGVLGRETALPPGVQPTQRAEELSVEQLVWLAERVTMAPGEDAPEVS
jgi:16S rRNA (adenine1518-N6/adenine1519-N6)-dimethyltransferase